jgi:hypothetical protein
MVRVLMFIIVLFLPTIVYSGKEFAPRTKISKTAMTTLRVHKVGSAIARSKRPVKLTHKED